MSDLTLDTPTKPHEEDLPLDSEAESALPVESEVDAPLPIESEVEAPSPAPPPPEASKQKKIIIGAVALLLVLVIYLLRFNDAVGLAMDDAWYVLLAQALATGQGYSLINSPTPGILPLYPPGFPALLSVFYRLSPHFPENLWLLKSVSIAAMLGAGAVSYYYFTRLRNCPRYVALLLGTGVSLCAPLVFLATSSLMSECVFTFAVILAVTLIEKSVQARSAGKFLILGAVITSFAFLTRSTAIALIIAVGLYLLKERLFRSLILFSTIIALLCGPWVIYSRLHAPTPEQREEQRGHIVEPYTTQLWQRVAGDPSAGTITVGDLPARVWTNFLGLAARDLSRILVAPIAEDLTKESLRRRIESGDGQAFAFDEGSILSLALFAFVLMGFLFALREKLTLAELVTVLSLLMIFLWPWEVMRFVLPLIAFLLFYFATGWRVIHSLHQRLNEATNPRTQWKGVAVVAALIVVINYWGNARTVFRSQETVVSDSISWQDMFDEHRKMMKWIANSTPRESVIAAYNPPMVYLFTGRKTISADDPKERWELWNKLNVRYLAATGLTPLPPISDDERRYEQAYRPSGVLGLRVLDLGSPQSRPRWGGTP